MRSVPQHFSMHGRKCDQSTPMPDANQIQTGVYVVTAEADSWQMQTGCIEFNRRKSALM